MDNNIKLGVSLYSLTTDYVKKNLDLEGCLKSVADMGFQGIEIVAAQMVPEYPNPSDRWLYEFRDLLQKYNLQPVCYSAYIDMGMRSERDMNREEIMQFTYNDMLYAKKAGFQMVRTQHAISPEILEAMVPACEALDMKLTIEMHHPHHPKVPVWEKYLALMNKYEHLGVVPDFSIFQNRPHRLLVERLVRAGFRKEKLDGVLKAHEQQQPWADAARELALTKEETDFTEALYEKFTPCPLEESLEVLSRSPPTSTASSMCWITASLTPASLMTRFFPRSATLASRATLPPSTRATTLT